MNSPDTAIAPKLATVVARMPSLRTSKPVKEQAIK